MGPTLEKQLLAHDSERQSIAIPNFAPNPLINAPLTPYR
jgi:hypothetical protein